MWENSWPKTCLLIRFWWQNTGSQRPFAARSLEIRNGNLHQAHRIVSLLSACSLLKADLWWLQKRCLLQDAWLKIRSKRNTLSCIISSWTSRCWNHQLRTLETCPLWQGLADWAGQQHGQSFCFWLAQKAQTHMLPAQVGTPPSSLYFSKNHWCGAIQVAPDFAEAFWSIFACRAWLTNRSLSSEPTVTEVAQSPTAASSESTQLSASFIPASDNTMTGETKYRDRDYWFQLHF